MLIGIEPEHLPNVLEALVKVKMGCKKKFRSRKIHLISFLLFCTFSHNSFFDTCILDLCMHAYDINVSVMLFLLIH